MLDILARTPRVASHPAAWSLAAAFPRLFSGAALHRLALRALDARDHAMALALFDQAGIGYRREGVVHALARMRVHEMMARVRAGEGAMPLATGPDSIHRRRPARAATPAERQALVLETERRLAKLDRIERLEPPFALVDAREILGTWCAGEGSSEHAANAA